MLKNLIEQLMQWLGFKIEHPAAARQTSALRELLENARQAKRSEDYPRALSLFEKALEQAVAAGDMMAQTVIHLHHADILVEQRRWDEAKAMLDAVKQSAEALSQQTPLA